MHLVFYLAIFVVYYIFTFPWYCIFINISGQLYEVIGVVYQYIKLLRETDPQKWIFEELQDIGKMEFRFAEEQPQDDYAASLAGTLFFLQFFFQNY